MITITSGAFRHKPTEPIPPLRTQTLDKTVRSCWFTAIKATTSCWWEFSWGQIHEWHDAAQEHQLVKYSFESMLKYWETVERMIEIKQRRTRIGDAVDRMSKDRQQHGDIREKDWEVKKQTMPSCCLTRGHWYTITHTGDTYLVQTRFPRPEPPRGTSQTKWNHKGFNTLTWNQNRLYYWLIF